MDFEALHSQRTASPRSFILFLVPQSFPPLVPLFALETLDRTSPPTALRAIGLCTLKRRTSTALHHEVVDGTKAVAVTGIHWQNGTVVVTRMSPDASERMIGPLATYCWIAQGGRALANCARASFISAGELRMTEADTIPAASRLLQSRDRTCDRGRVDGQPTPRLGATYEVPTVHTNLVLDSCRVLHSMRANGGSRFLYREGNPMFYEIAP